MFAWAAVVPAAPVQCSAPVFDGLPGRSRPAATRGPPPPPPPSSSQPHRGTVCGADFIKIQPRPSQVPGPNLALVSPLLCHSLMHRWCVALHTRDYHCCSSASKIAFHCQAMQAFWMSNSNNGSFIIEFIIKDKMKGSQWRHKIILFWIQL